MKKILPALSALAISTVAASAADLAPAPYTKAPVVVPPPVFSWTGFYVGANIGGAWDFDWAANNNGGNGVLIPALGNTYLLTSNDRWITTVAARFGWAFD